MSRPSPAPAIGRQVVYRSRTGDYDLAATITAVTSTLNPEAVQRLIASGGVDLTLENEDRVHLHVLTPGPEMCYQEHNVPFDAAYGDAAQRPAAGMWRWPFIPGA